MGFKFPITFKAVSYTHLDVYKRQVIIGVLVAIIRYSYDKNHTNKAGNFIQSLLQFLLAVANGICHVYLTIIRGVPVVVQLMIIY